MPSLSLLAGGEGAAVVATLAMGDSVLIVESDAEDPNYVLVMSLEGDLSNELAIPFGWAFERSGDAVQIRREVVTNSTSGTLLVEEFRALGPAGGLVAYGGGLAPDVVGFLVEGCGTGLSPRLGEPDWLNGTFASVPVAGVTIPPGGSVPQDIIFLRASPGVAASTCDGVAAGWYRFNGHFDDPAAATCRTRTSPDGSTVVEIDADLAVLLCRLRYVITGLEPMPTP